jgi:uncharacterized membrane protein
MQQQTSRQYQFSAGQSPFQRVSPSNYANSSVDIQSTQPNYNSYNGYNLYSSGSYYYPPQTATHSPYSSEQSPIGSPGSSIHSPASPTLTINENTSSISSYETSAATPSSNSPILKYTSYPATAPHQSSTNNYSTDSPTSSVYPAVISDPSCYNTAGNPYNYTCTTSYFANSGTGNYSTPSASIYPFQDYSHYHQASSITGNSSIPSLWSYHHNLPAAVTHLSKVSYDSPRYKLTPERAIPLIKWFEEHKEHPYPSRQEKMLLCQTTQLTFTQVSTWFANARRRMKKAAQEDEENEDIDIDPSE